MTCYWDSIYSQLNVEDYKFIGVDTPPNIESLVRLMKSKNKYINNVTWQNSYLSHDEKKEHYTAIDVYNIKGINISSNDGIFEGVITLKVHNVTFLKELTSKLEKMKAISSITRTYKHH